MNKQKSAVPLRAHHLMCVHGFEGKGYSPAYVKNFWEIVEKLKAGTASAEVVNGADAVCGACPNQDHGVCRPGGMTDEPKIRGLDEAWAKTLDVRAGDVLSLGQIEERVRNKVSAETFEKNCAPCSWRALGVCRKALDRIKGAATLAVVVLIFAQGADAKVRQRKIASPQPQKSTVAVDAVAPPSRQDVIPAERVKELIAAEKSKAIPGLRKILDAISKKQYPAALKDLKALESNPEFGDYMHLLAGQCELGRMHDAIRKGQSALAVQSGESAIRHLKDVVSSNPYTPLEKRAAILLADAEVHTGLQLARQKKAPRARPLMENGFQRLSERNLLVMLQKEAIAAYGQLCDKKPDEMCTSWEIRLSTTLPKADRFKVLPRLASISIPTVERAGTVPYKSDLDLVQFQDAFKLYLDGKFPEAFNLWDDLLQKYPKTNIKLRVKFWMARAAQKAKQDARAETLYREVIKEIPFSFYALMASWYSGIDVLRMVDAELPMAKAEAQLPSPADMLHVHRSEILLASRAPELARLELRDVKPSAAMTNEFLVYLAMLNYMAENHMMTFQIASELSARGYTGLTSSFGERLVFPTTTLSSIEQAAKSNKLDPLIVLSLIKQESAFNADAVSVSPAFGLMQLIPPTARDLDPKIEVYELFDPTKNVALGSRYLRQLLTKYKGDIIWALAAYNSGPGNADRWRNEIAQRPNIAPEEAIEFIQFRETHDYVQNILRNYNWYTRRQKGDGFVHLQALLQNFN